MAFFLGFLFIIACVAFGAWHDRRVDKHLHDFFRRHDD